MTELPDHDDASTGSETDSYLMTILSKKFEAVSRDITHSLLKSARSGVINVARDFSSAITLQDGRQFIIEEGLPVHLGNISLVIEYALDHFDDISEGDCFLTNSPYAGNTHHADFTVFAPVFHDGEHLFWSINRAHQADVGGPEPSTYLPNAENVYQEGPHFPAVRIQEEYEDKHDIVRMLKENIRLGDRQWYGDYRAQVAAVRTGEENIQDIVEEYGIDTVEQFASDWLDYGKQMMESEIRELPDAEVEHTTYHDSLPGAPDGVPVTATIDIDPNEPKITVDLTGNTLENLPCGFNLCRATTIAGAYSGVFNSLNSNIPHNEGSLGQIDVSINSGTVVGDPEFPAATSVATTNVADELFNAVQAAFGQLDGEFGIAEGNSGNGPGFGVVSGNDPRNDDEPYVNQLVYTGGGGPAVYGHDGWVAYGIAVTSGVLYSDSIEVDERKHPILFEQNEVRTDAEGAGRWRGAPGHVLEYGPRDHTMTVSYMGDQIQYPPKGIKNGSAAAPSGVCKIDPDGDRSELPGAGTVEIEAGETVLNLKSGGGGYGDPYKRPPEAVRDDVREGLVSVERAREVYGVAVAEGTEPLQIDREETATLRNNQEDES